MQPCPFFMFEHLQFRGFQTKCGQLRNAAGKTAVAEETGRIQHSGTDFKLLIFEFNDLIRSRAPAEHVIYIPGNLKPNIHSKCAQYSERSVTLLIPWGTGLGEPLNQRGLNSAAEPSSVLSCVPASGSICVVSTSKESYCGASDMRWSSSLSYPWLLPITTTLIGSVQNCFPRFSQPKSCGWNNPLAHAPVRD